jgi:sulfoxide reductase heme-binding subunit YedZ
VNLHNSSQPPQLEHQNSYQFNRLALSLIAIGMGLVGSFLISPLGAPVRAFLASLFALNSDQAMWYLTRTAGMMAYLLLWLSTVWGLVIPSKLFGEILSGDFTFDFHKFISLLSLGFLGLHIFVLTADHYLPFTMAQLLVPFLSPYRPLWVGIGIITFYLLLLVTVTFYLRKQIGMKTFRLIHYTSLVAYLGAVIHAFMSGTDSPLPAVMLIYLGSFSVVIFLTVYWLVRLWVNHTVKIRQATISSIR